MARYIDVDKIDFSILEDASNRTLTKLFILNQPTLEIVRCEDCYYCKKPEDDWNFYCTRNEGNAHKVSYDDFCSRGLSRKVD